jgi:hypothetical protein
MTIFPLIGESLPILFSGWRLRAIVMPALGAGVLKWLCDVGGSQRTNVDFYLPRADTIFYRTVDATLTFDRAQTFTVSHDRHTAHFFAPCVIVPNPPHNRWVRGALWNTVVVAAAAATAAQHGAFIQRRLLLLFFQCGLLHPDHSDRAPSTMTAFVGALRNRHNGCIYKTNR